MTDRLTLSRALEEGGIARAAAENIATEIFVALHDNSATKADVESVKAELISRIDSVRTELTSRLDNVRAELLLRLSELEHRMTARFGSPIVIVTGIILAAIRYMPRN